MALVAAVVVERLPLWPGGDLMVLVAAAVVVEWSLKASR